MKTFILNETAMAGTVTIKTITTIYQAENFEKVVNKLKDNLHRLKENFLIEEDNDQKFSYVIAGQKFPVQGCIFNKERAIVKI